MENIPKSLKELVEEKGIEPSTFALRMLPRARKPAKPGGSEGRKGPETGSNGHGVAQTGHSWWGQFWHRRRARQLARRNRIAGTAWVAFERGEITVEAFRRVMRDVGAR
jgi:hypothetical protein